MPLGHSYITTFEAEPPRTYVAFSTIALTPAFWWTLFFR